MSELKPSLESSNLSPKKPLFPSWLWRSIFIIFLLLGIGALGLKFWRSTTDNIPSSSLLTQSIERKTIPVNITANGTIKAKRSINLSPKTSGIIKKLFVEEGDWVNEGQLVALMDDSNLQGQLIQLQAQLAQQQENLNRLVAGNRPEDIAKAEAQLEEAKASLQELRSGNRPQEIAQAEAKLQQAQATLQQKELDVRRYQQLYDQGAITRQTWEQSITDRNVAESTVREAEESLALWKAGTRSEEIIQAQARVEQQAQTVALLKAGNRSEDIAIAKAQVEAAKGALKTVLDQLEDTKILAPFNGIVLKKYADEGSFVSPSMSGNSESASSSSILTLSSQKHEVVVNISESQLTQVKVGQSVVIKADAIADQNFTGKVERIAPQATVAQNVTSFEVRVEITSANAQQLRVGMNVEAEFQVGNLDNVILVPNAAVVRQKEGTGVYILNPKGQPVFKTIKTGVTVGQQTEVQAGLEGNEQVLLSPPTPTPKSGFQLPRPRFRR